MKLGFITACLPRRTLPQLCEWAAAEGYEALEVAAWPDLGDRPFTATHLAVERFGDAEADATRELFAKHGLELSSIALYDNNLHPDSTERDAINEHVARCIDAAALVGCPTVGTFVGRDPTRSVADNLREAEGVFRPLVDRAGEAGVKLIVENCVMEGWHPDGYPGNLAYSPALGVDVRPRAVPELRPVPPGVDGHRPGRGAAALHRPHPPRAGQGHPGRRAARNRYGWPGRAVVRDDPGTWAGGATGCRGWARSTGFDWSTRSTRAASTACCRSSTRTRCGAARRRRSRSACGSPTTRCAPCWCLTVAPATPVLEVRGLVKEYPGVRLGGGRLRGEARGGSLPRRSQRRRQVDADQVRLGAVEPTAGEIRMDGQPVATGDPSRALERGVATIYQERDLVEDLTVAQSIYLGHELRRWDSWTAGGCGRRRSRSCAGSTTRPSRRAPTSATCGRLVSRWYRSHALSRHVRLLIMDEPSAILDDSEIETMFGVVRRLTAEGVGVIYISHRLDEIRGSATADRAHRRRDGRLGTAGDHAPDQLVEHGRTQGRSALSRAPAGNGTVVLEVRGAAAPRRQARQLRGPLRGGARHRRPGGCRAQRAPPGHLRRRPPRCRRGAGGRAACAAGPARPVDAAGLGLAPEDRKSQALLLDWNLIKNVTLADVGRFQRGLIRTRAERSAAEEQLRALGTVPDDGSRMARSCPGGNQQKVVLARWLLHQCRVLLLDEPTRGVDVATKAQLYRLIADLAAWAWWSCRRSSRSCAGSARGSS